MKYSIPSILPNGGRRIAIGDIHGCALTFKALFQKLQIQKTDQLFLLGDLVDKGPRSRETVDFTVQLQGEGFQIYVVKGNHEHYFLTSFSHGKEVFLEHLKSQYCEPFLGDDLYFYLQYFHQMPYCYDLGDWLMLHAHYTKGVFPIFRSFNKLFPKIELDIPLGEFYQKRQIIGHTITPISEIKKRVANREKIICLDSGCVQKGEAELGVLTAMDLDSWELFFQENID